MEPRLEGIKDHPEQNTKPGQDGRPQVIDQWDRLLLPPLKEALGAQPSPYTKWLTVHLRQAVRRLLVRAGPATSAPQGWSCQPYLFVMNTNGA
ncbi:hypothetical protein J6590_068427 [Homalodisca vitripennis]|nr:hypothetical protein J6590_068427 [Homalodisca vitripennis]